jgi:hypothetical protein
MTLDHPPNPDASKKNALRFLVCANVGLRRLAVSLLLPSVLLPSVACGAPRAALPREGSETVPPADAGRGEDGSEGEQDEERVVVVGTLTDEGVECPALRDEEGELYTLTGDLGDFGPGDRVRVEGTVARFSICMQGTTLAVERIERVPGEEVHHLLRPSRPGPTGVRAPTNLHVTRNP